MFHNLCMLALLHELLERGDCDKTYGPLGYTEHHNQSTDSRPEIQYCFTNMDPLRPAP